MAGSDTREALRGAEEEAVDLLAEALTSEQWTELLKAPLERAAHWGNRGLVEKLVKDTLHAAIRGASRDRD